MHYRLNSMMRGASLLALALATPAFAQAPAESAAPGEPSTDVEAETETETDGAATAGTGTAGVAVGSAGASAGGAAVAAAPSGELAAAPEPSEAELAEKSAAADAEDAALDAEADALLESAAEQADVRNYALDIYGFSDFTYRQGLNDDDRGQFFVGNLNLYMTADLGDRWRSMAEVRFTYLPNGGIPAGQTERQLASYSDYTDLDRQLPVGGVILQRAWLEYSAHPLLNIRAGQFLTPYGIWNVDHGSPVIIGSRRPFVIGERLFPEWQTGFQIHGSHHVGHAELGYNVTLSNGRGPIDMYFDMDSNKAVGGRLYANFDTKIGDIALGTSAYGGKYTSSTGDGFFAPIAISEQYNEFAFGVDAKWTWGGFLLQGELITNDTRYTNRGRPTNAYIGGYLPDHQRWGLYGLTGYRFDFLGIMPFAALDFSDPGPTGFAEEATAFWGGINMRPTPRVVLKVQYTYSWYPSGSLWQDFHYSTIDTQAAWSF